LKKCLKKSLLKKFENITNCQRGGREGGEGGEGGREGGELLFQCLRPSTSLMAAGKKSCQGCSTWLVNPSLPGMIPFKLKKKFHRKK
jgi:hypothetical protein